MGIEFSTTVGGANEEYTPHTVDVGPSRMNGIPHPRWVLKSPTVGGGFWRDMYALLSDMVRFELTVFDNT